MKRKQLWKRSLAMVMAAAMLVGSNGITDYGLTTVQAGEVADPQGNGSWVATNYIVNGDFETESTAEAITGWTLNTTALLAPKSAGTDQWMTNNTTGYLNISADSAADFSMSQKITIPAGTYKLTADSEGGAFNNSTYTLALGDLASLSLTNPTAYNTWVTDTSDTFEVTTAGEYTLALTASLENGYWGDVDNIVLYQWVASTDHSYAQLGELIASVPSDYASMGFTADSTAALASALTAANACTAESESADIEAAYVALSAAVSGLVFDADIFVTKIADYDADSIRGVDVSSYITIMDSFDALKEQMKAAGAAQSAIDAIGFKDWNGNVLTRQGFFDLLAASGVNYVRIRVWNNPYDASGNGYGGGDNDLTKAVEMGKYTTAAGMKVLIDFHFSDFWADPGKQDAPKAWADYTVAQKAAAISEYVTSSLNTLIVDNQVDVSMVQIGNETTGSICGESDWANMDILFDAGCDAIHAFNTAHSTDILAALHFTNPEKSGRYASFGAKLADYDGDSDGTKEGVSYDVFASSYYPYWHGTLDNLTSVLADIAKIYDKYVMVAETSWATTLDDGDGHDNTVRTGNNDTDNSYSFTVQGQANEVREVANAVNNVNVTLTNGDNAALGFFYWEPAWIPVQYAYNEDGTVNADIVASNKALWEEYGSGWAASYASEYDPDDAGVWFGGSAIDNQAVFDFNGNPLASLNMFKYLQYGAVAPLAVESSTCEAVSVEVGGTLTADMLSDATVSYNDGTSAVVGVNWSADDIAAVNTAAATSAGIGSYTINGTLTDASAAAVSCTVTVIPTNLLKNSGFEDSASNWTLTGDGLDGKYTDDPRTGSKAVHFYNGSALDFTVTQTVEVANAGVYSAFFYIQGGANTGSNDGEAIYVTAATKNKTATSDNAVLQGWKVWQQPTVSKIVVTQDMIDTGDNVITLTLHVKANSGAWGTIDDANLYYAYSIPVDISSYDVTLSEDTYTYDGTEKKPAVTVKNGNEELDASAYTVAYTKNIDAGKATVTVSAAEDSIYTGTITKDFTIEKAAKNITVNTTTYTKTAGDAAFALNASADNGEALTYTSSNTKVAAVDAKGTVTIVGVGTTQITIASAATANYNAAASKTVTITVNKAAASVQVAKTSYSKTYGNKVFSLNASSTDKSALTYKTSSSKIVTVSSTGNVTIKGCGKATITITSAGTDNTNAASATVTVTVKPKKAQLGSVKSTKKAQITVKWSKDSKAKGYEIKYSTSKKFTKVKTVTIKKASTTSTTIKKLTKGKKYYVKVRSYTTVNGKKVYGSYSSVKAVTVKKK